jgi:DNA-binding transcriptional LysR family regulator
MVVAELVRRGASVRGMVHKAENVGKVGARGVAKAVRLLIGFSASATLEVLPKILRKYRRLYRNVMVQLSEIATIRDAELLLDSPLSVGFLRSPSFFNEESFCIETILREPFVVAMPDSHPAAKQDSVRIKTLAGELFIVPLRQPGWDYSDAIFRILRDNGVERVAQEARGYWPSRA